MEQVEVAVVPDTAAHVPRVVGTLDTSAGSSWNVRRASSIPDMTAAGTPWLTTWKKPTVSAAAFTSATRRALVVAPAARSMVGMLLLTL